MTLTDQHLQWIKSREQKFQRPQSFTSAELVEIFSILGHIEDRVVRPTSCNRCIKTNIDKVWKEYQNSKPTS